MIDILPQSRDQAFGFRVTGALSSDDIAALTPRLDAAIAHHGRPIGLLLDIARMHGASWHARFDEMHFLRHHADKLARIAVVSDDQWQELGERVLLASAGLLAETLYFSSSDIEHAWHWVRFSRSNSIPVPRRIAPGRGLFADYTPEYMDV